MNKVNVGAKCPNCGAPPSQELHLPIPDPLKFYCIACDQSWTATKAERERAIGFAAGILASGAG